MPRIIEALDIGQNVLETPFRIIVSGSSGVGKTELVKEIVNKEFYKESMENVIYCYPDYLSEIPTEFDIPVQYHQGIPDVAFMSSLAKKSLLILDDMMCEVSKCENISKLFSVIARKRQISIILIVQNIFQRGPHFRNIRLNSTGIILFKTRSTTSNRALLRELDLNNLISKKSLDDALSEKHEYIFIDIHPNHQNDFGSIRGNIFSNYLRIYYKMEYIAIPKADFIKYFKIIEAKKGKIKAVKNEITIKKKLKRKRKEKSSSPDTNFSSTDRSISSDSD